MDYVSTRETTEIDISHNPPYIEPFSDRTQLISRNAPKAVKECNSNKNVIQNPLDTSNQCTIGFNDSEIRTKTFLLGCPGMYFMLFIF